MTDDPFEALGVSRQAGDDEIKAAFRRLAKKYHPDITGGPAEKFRRILWAYEHLAGYGRADRDERGDEYDFEIRVEIDRKRTVQDLFDDLRDGVLTVFDIDKPEYLNLFLELTPQQAARGGRVRLDLPLTKKCHRCWGFGKILFRNCPACGGSGEKRYRRATVLNLPAGVTDGWRAKSHIDSLFLTVIAKIDTKGQ